MAEICCRIPAARRGAGRTNASVPTWGLLLRRSQGGLHGCGRQFVAAEIFWTILRPFFVVGRLHLGHSREGLRVVIGGVPEQESDATFDLCGLHLDLYVL